MKTVLITGASSGFGYATTLLLAQKGYTVYAGVRDLQKKESLELKGHDSIHVIKLDVTQQADIDNLKDIAPNIDILINNAGLGYLGATEEFAIEEIKEQFEINFYGAIRLIKRIAPFMRKRKQGRIINVSSISGLISFPIYGVYSASKFALEAYSESLRFELRPFHVHVALIEPGSFLTGFTSNRHMPQAQSDPNSDYYPLTHTYFENFKTFNKTKNHASLSKILGPERVARRILKVIESPNPPFHNLIGGDAHFLYTVYRRLPQWLKDFFLAHIFKWK